MSDDKEALSEVWPLPPGAREYLRPDNPKLLALRDRYARYTQFAHSQWAPEVLAHDLKLSHFRADNVYNWQVRTGLQEINYLLTAYYVKDTDRLGLWERLTEDGLFGAHTFDFNRAHRISRDLLDSIAQLNFLDRHIGLSRLRGATVLDIGAGYGRLAWRMARGLRNLARVWCTDAVPESTFVCDYFLSYRQVKGIAGVVPLDEVETFLRGKQLDLVTNIHSFSECTLEAIQWWLGVLDRASVTYLMIVPNVPDQLLTIEREGPRLDFLPALEEHGYRLVKKEFLFEGAPSVQAHGVYGDVKVWLFRRDN